jgi:protein farnesyltransferase/geranylgeranyltransferase type-1 subunit alpha
MANDEYSPRCLRLTEDVINMNPAHYTVWLYRFKNIATLNVPIPDEISWLNIVSLEHLKNYQIWHHRQLLIDHYYPQIAEDPEQVRNLARTETRFLATMLAEDSKNYHVWSYRQYMVRKLSQWTPQELASTQSLIEDDVRNNSAWSHRFFLVFSNPTYSTPKTPSTAHDPALPAEVVDRELAYTREKIALAPQNQAAWNYLRGVLVKGGRSFSSVEDLVSELITGLSHDDAEEGKEQVRSSYALDLLAEVYQEKGNKAMADLCLRRLAAKWDPIRAGYWNYRRQLL